MTFASPRGPEFEPFAIGGLDALLAAAARDAPDALLVVDDEGRASAGVTARRMERMAVALAAAGLRPGERVLVAAGAQTCALVAVAGALQAGLVPVLAPCGLEPVELAGCARAAEAVALVGPSRYGSLALSDTYLSTAAIANGIRLLATQGPEEVDGTLDVSAAALDAMGGDAAVPAPPTHATPIGTFEATRFEGSHKEPRLVLHRQAGLLADALALVEQARINPSRRMLVTVPPTSLAGLVAGPFAALLGAGSLCWHGPFEAARFLAACDAEPGAHVVAPAAIGAAFREPALAANFGSLILVSRHARPDAFTPPESIACDRPIVDLYAFGEETVLSRRRIDGIAQLPERVDDRSDVGALGTQLNRARAASLAQGERS